MERFILKGHKASEGLAEGEALVSRTPFSFSFVHQVRGTVFSGMHELSGESIKDKILVFPFGCGPTTDEHDLYILKEMGLAPKAIINTSAYPVVTIGAIISNIPMVYGFAEDLLSMITTGDQVKVDANNGIVEVSKRGSS